MRLHGLSKTHRLEGCKQLGVGGGGGCIFRRGESVGGGGVCILPENVSTI